MRDLFTTPTVAALAERIHQLQPSDELHATAVALPTVVPAPEQSHEPFPLTDVQQAYWLGRSDAFAMGNVATHVYFEFDLHGIDVARLEWAWQQLIERHAMLRMVIRPDGQQQILPSVPPYRFTQVNLSSQPAATVDATLAAIRNELSHQVLPTEQWPLFELRTTQLAGDQTRLHLSLDILLTDGLGC